METRELKSLSEAERPQDAQVVLSMLRHTAAELARANAEMDLLVQAVSHDLREPLRMLGAYAQLLARRYQGQLDADADQFLTFMSDGAQRMQHLTDDLSAYAALGRGTLHRTACDSRAVLEQALAPLEAEINRVQAELRIGNMPPVVADASGLARLFGNLVDNSLRYRHPDRRPVIDILGTEVEGGWHFRVSDNGVSVPVGEADRIFMVFQRLHGSEKPGTGLGLSICKRLVERHGGRIWVEPHAESLGTTFHFTLLRVL